MTPHSFLLDAKPDGIQTPWLISSQQVTCLCDLKLKLTLKYTQVGSRQTRNLKNGPTS
jgi:hypothetical protein